MPTKKRILMLIESSTSYGRGMARGIARYAQRRGDWEITVQPRGMAEPIPALRSERWDGVISRLSDHRAAESVRRLDCPTVELLYDEQVPVFGDDDAIASLALDHFARLGFERVGFFSFGGCFWIRHRRESFLRECRRRGLSAEVFDPLPSSRDRRPEPLWREGNEEALDKWIGRLPRPTAILAANDHQAIWLLNACRRRGAAVPDSIAICGVNNDEHLCEIVSPTLTSIDQNAERIGREAARLLEMKIDGRPVVGYPRKIPPLGLVERQSTDAFPNDDSQMVRAYRLIRDQAVFGLRVADVMAECSVTERSLQRWFKKRFGHTPEKEIALIRLRKAKELLRTTNLSIRAVAEQSGFSSERYFSQAFRRLTGMSPNQYRQRRGDTRQAR
ncbi:MAG: XylR family transcriptional regulator [Thermoguttaceae bacterium]|nr:XylR family transcriptional regulator [Thermoguttaceae bacterium]